MEEFTIPSQLQQAFIEVPSKDRLMALAGLLRQARGGPGFKLREGLLDCL